MSTVAEHLTPDHRVFVVDDHELVRESVAKLIAGQRGFTVAGQAGRTDDAIAGIGRVRPDIVVLDISVPGGGGIEVARAIRGSAPETKVIFLTMHDDDATVSSALSTGADGYVLKSASIDEVLQAIRSVAEGGSFLSPHVARRVLSRAGGRGDAADLTARELEILQLLADGLRPADVASKLFVSLKTVRNHLASVYVKLGVASAAQAISEGLRRGLVRVGA
jgi:DNA-binding NarL/FixJ family response regulator